LAGQRGEKIKHVRIEIGRDDFRPVTEETKWTQCDTAARPVPETKRANGIRLMRVTRELFDEMRDSLEGFWKR